MIIPLMVAASVPMGMDLLGLARSPDRPTPAVIPVNAGNIIAKTKKNGSFSLVSLESSGNVSVALDRLMVSDESMSVVICSVTGI